MKVVSLIKTFLLVLRFPDSEFGRKRYKKNTKIFLLIFLKVRPVDPMSLAVYFFSDDGPAACTAAVAGATPDGADTITAGAS